VGYGDIYATNYNEMIFVIIFLLVGIAIYSYSLSKMISLFEEITQKENFLREKEHSVKEFCRNHNLSKSLYHQIRNYLLDNDSKRNSYYSYDKLVHDFRELTLTLPNDLNQQIYFDVFKEKIKRMPLFNDVKNEKFLIFLCSIIDIRYLNMNEVVFKPGDLAKEIFIVWRGTLIMYNSLNLKNFEEYCLKKSPAFTVKSTSYSNEERRLYSQERLKIMTYLTKFDIIGETDIWKNDGMTRKFTVKAKKDCALILLRKPDIKFLFEIDPWFKLKVSYLKIKKKLFLVGRRKNSKRNSYKVYFRCKN
jgi:hypothetical protein